MASLSAVQQFAFEAYLSFSQRSPIGKVDITKFRRLVHEVELSNSEIPKLNPEVIEEVFARCVMMGTRRLEFEPFEKTLIMLSMIYFPNLNAADSYMSFVVKVLSRIPSISSLGYASSSLDGLSAMADIVLGEKVHACTFHTVFVSELGKTPLCEACVGNVIGDSRLYRRKKVDVASSPLPTNSVLAAPPLPVPEPIELVSAPAVPSEKNVLLPKEDEVRPPVAPLPFRNTYVGFPPRSPTKPRPTKNLAAPCAIEEAAKVYSKPSQLEGAQNMYLLATDFEAMLMSNFGCLEYAFDYMDSARGTRRGQVSKTTFLYCCEMFGASLPPQGDMSTLFAFLDTKSDGVLDLEELLQWKPTRTAYIRRLEQGRPSSGASEAFFYNPVRTNTVAKYSWSEKR